MDANSQDLSLSEASPRLPDRQECFLCHGVGHWARHCTSLPSVYLADNPPKCYCCGGTGHFARFCPSSKYQVFPLVRVQSQQLTIDRLGM